MENPEKIEIAGLKTIHKLCKFGADNNMEGCTFTEIVERMFDELAKAQSVPEGYAVVPVEPKQETIKQMNKVWFESNCAHIMKTKTAELLYKAMIEAQEPAND